MKKLLTSILLLLTIKVNAQLTYNYQSDTNALMDKDFLYYEIVMEDSSVFPLIDYRNVFEYKSKDTVINKVFNCIGSKLWVKYQNGSIFAITNNDYPVSYKFYLKLCGNAHIIYVRKGEVYKIE